MEYKRFFSFDLVEWESQAGGHWTNKKGVVVGIVPKNTHPSSLNFPALRTDVYSDRNHESYIVRVKVGKTQYRDYWPRVSALRWIQGIEIISL